jgi:glycosyltransferase involved in cell wall biosynthesis
VIDDGSTDATAEVSAMYSLVKYIYQENAGLSSARNTGIGQSKGEYLVFLDADDRLLPDALSSGQKAMEIFPGSGFVFGGYHFIDGSGKKSGGGKRCDFEMEKNPYLGLLRSNFIGMHAAVLYRRDSLLNAGGFNTKLRACEDYEVYLKIASTQPVHYHNNIIAEYRKHGENMTGDPSRMLKSSLSVLKSHKPNVPDKKEYKEAYRSGLKYWKQYYGIGLLNAMKSNMVHKKFGKGFKQFFLILKISPELMNQFFYTIILKLFPGLLPGLMKARKNNVKVPARGKVLWGDLRRTKPISKNFGFDRGKLPVDRYFIEGFLHRNSEYIKGNVLEIGERIYTKKFGLDKVKNSHIFHADASHPDATYSGDIARAVEIPDDFYDCVIFTQTLQYIYDFEGAVKQLHRILKPGGALLFTVPGLSQISHDQWSDLWLYNFTSSALEKIFSRSFSQKSHLEIESFGNVLTATAAMYGLAAEELEPEELSSQDPLYQLVNTVLAIKS